MKAAPPPMDPSAKRWLALLGAVVLVFLAIMLHGFLGLRSSPPTKQPQVQSPSAVRPAPQPFVEIPPAPIPMTPTQKEAVHKEMVHQQAQYLRELSAKYPKTASLPKPEEIDEMEKKGRLVW